MSSVLSSSHKRGYHPNWTKGAVYGALLIADTDAKDENDGGDNVDDCDNDNGEDNDIDNIYIMMKCVFVCNEK